MSYPSDALTLQDIQELAELYGEKWYELEEAVLKKTYRAKALNLHPDKNPNSQEAETKFKQLNHWNSILMDEKQRNQLLDDRKQLRGKQHDSKPSTSSYEQSL